MRSCRAYTGDADDGGCPPPQLDAGVEERIMLVSRDEQSCLVVSYREIKSCVESAFRCVLCLLIDDILLRPV